MSSRVAKESLTTRGSQAPAMVADDHGWKPLSLSLPLSLYLSRSLPLSLPPSPLHHCDPYHAHGNDSFFLSFSLSLSFFLSLSLSLSLSFSFFLFLSHCLFLSLSLSFSRHPHNKPRKQNEDGGNRSNEVRKTKRQLGANVARCKATGKLSTPHITCSHLTAGLSNC